MRVILLQDVRNVGKKDQIVEVSDGYANNFLMPKKLAVLYTDRSIEILNSQKENRAKAVAEEKQKAEELALKLKDITVEFTAKVSKDGRMFGTISPKQIEGELKTKYNIVIDKRKFIDHYPVNAIGYTRLRIELYKDVIGVVNVHVSEEQ
ncbi:MAG: 50S ribosomal protein L9 [Bacilli bacterium]|jgi:large subunit ribosomal protein L9|nr:50S ribosomal protein L9 [Bacilli bacterium]MCH4201731.1 50S ribosomal protein L9 [Bacilli bacterium]